MPATVSGFSFDAESLQLSKSDDFVAVVGLGIRTREKLFDVLRRELRLPDYFGKNWDALSDCLRDLSWIDERRVVIEHMDLPQLDEKDLAIYVDVLAECVQDWKAVDHHQLVVVFPAAVRETVAVLKGAAKG